MVIASGEGWGWVRSRSRRNDVSDRYRHRLRGQLATDATLLDEYLVGSGATVIFLRATDSPAAPFQGLGMNRL